MVIDAYIYHIGQKGIDNSHYFLLFLVETKRFWNLVGNVVLKNLFLHILIPSKAMPDLHPNFNGFREISTNFAMARVRLK